LKDGFQANCLAQRARWFSPAPETIADRREWINQRLPSGRSYRETIDPAFVSLFDIDAARAAASFDKLLSDRHGSFAKWVDRERRRDGKL